ncbi:Secreted protein with uncharacterized domain [Pseudoalteromonas luteoviolacea B = ATCC 29581]|nr:Secreted protein with uncharacterized domain [Pseudoalteromonas luteoviolacea B = ATCC 29581]
MVLVALLTTIVTLYFSALFLLRAIVLEISPTAAVEEANIGISRGIGFSRGHTVYLLSSEATINVQAKTYQSTQVSVDAYTHTILHVELLPKPANVNVTIDMESEHVFDWYIDGHFIQSAPQLMADIAPKNVVIEARHPWFDTNALSLNLKRAEQYRETIRASLLQGQIELSSTPQGAAVMLDSTVLGITPLKLPINAGEHQLALSLSEFEPLRLEFEVNRHELNLKRHFNLTPEQAKLHISLLPQDGILTIDQAIITPNEDGEISIDANKVHKLRYEKMGFKPYKQSIKLKAGEHESISVSLEKAFGTVMLDSNAHAEVWLGETLLGKTPLNLELQTIPTSLVFKKQGFRTVVKEISPQVGKPIGLSVQMLNEFDARRREGKKTAAENLGISFISVVPTEFTMGSPVNEPGRQRDEHEIKVNLQKPFLVAKTELTETQFHPFDKSIAATQLPVTNVSWRKAVEYCNWLSIEDGLTPFYVIRGSSVTIDGKSKGYRLLSEAEYEFITKHFNRPARTTYVWGSEDRIGKKQGNFADVALKGQQTFVFEKYQDDHKAKAPVGSYKIDRNGFYDLDGNVREWVSDGYNVIPPNQTESFIDYIGNMSQLERVIKGASFQTGRLNWLRASSRDKGQDGQMDVGFRIARYQ